jgi:hypothetical protein
MLSLPHELILHIASYSGKDYVYEDFIEDLEEDNQININDLENLKQLQKEHGDGEYYPIRYLYATCKSFQWMSKLEYICIENGEFHSDITFRTINGLCHGMSYDVCTKTSLSGYTLYEHGKTIYENSMYTDTHYHYRKINGIVYKDQDDCDRWHDKTCKCSNCIQLNEIQEQIFTNDPYLREIFKANYDNGTVIIRYPSKFIKILTFDYCSEGLVVYK